MQIFSLQGRFSILKSLPLHLPQEQKYGENKRCYGIDKHPYEVRENACEISRKHCAFKIDRVNERQKIRDPSKDTANELEVEPGSRQPRRKVRKKRTAYPSDLLIGKNTSEQKSKRNIKKRDRQNKHDRKEDIHAEIKSKKKRSDIANDALPDSDWKDRERITENKINGRHRRRIKTLKKGTFPVLRNKRRGKEGQKRESEYSHARCQMVDRKKRDGNICLNCTEKKKEDEREAKPEAKSERITQQLLRISF